MHKFASVAVLFSCILALTACSIRQKVEPVVSQDEELICIIEDTAVRAGFLKTYEQELQARGYKVRVLPKGSDLRECPLTTTYVGYWSWDLANYLSLARIEVFRDGRRVGQAEYDSRSGRANLKKFVKGENKISELVQQLFPHRAGTPTPQ